MATIDMKALEKASRGDPQAQVFVTKEWIGVIIATIEQHLMYDTAGLRALMTPNGQRKVAVQKQWLAHIHSVLSNIDAGRKKSKTTTSSTKMTPSQESNFSKAFDHLDVAFQFLDRAFGGKSRF